MKKVIGLCLVTTMLFTLLLSGCGTKEAAETAASTTAAQEVSETTVQETVRSDQPEYFKKYAPEITLTQNAVVDGSFKFLDGESIDNNSYTRWVRETTGIIWKTKWVAPDADTDRQKLNIAAASNDLPDVIFGHANELGKLASAGLVIPVNELIEQYASPLVRYMIEQDMKSTKGNFYLPFTQNGKAYAFPQSIDNGAYWKTNWIRKDILTELGKKAPATLAEMEDILAAYHAKYPDGVGYCMSKDFSGGRTWNWSPLRSKPILRPGRRDRMEIWFMEVSSPV